MLPSPSRIDTKSKHCQLASDFSLARRISVFFGVFFSQLASDRPARSWCLFVDLNVNFLAEAPKSPGLEEEEEGEEKERRINVFFFCK